MSAAVPPAPQRPIWWRVLSYVRQVWNSLAAAGILPEQGQGPTGDGGQGKPKVPGR